MCLREPVCFRVGLKLNNPLLINQITFMFPLSQWGVKGFYDCFKPVLCFEYSWVLVLVLLLSLSYLGQVEPQRMGWGPPHEPGHSLMHLKKKK